MCLIAVSFQVYNEYPLVLLANRDEFYERPSAPLDEWPEHPGLFAGKDLRGGGTWMGMTRSGRLAAVTNFREPPSSPFESSRGELVMDFLTGTNSPSAYARELESRAGRYAGFNLLFGQGESLYYTSNRGGSTRQLEPGVYGLSNHLLDTPWPKVEAIKRDLSRAGPGANRDELLGLLSDETLARDDDLPDTGIGAEWERLLSSRFIRSESYGTRASNLVRVDRAGAVTMVERSFDASGPAGEVVKAFCLERRPEP